MKRKTNSEASSDVTNSPCSLRFVGPSSARYRSCTSAGREADFPLLGIETSPLCLQERREAASPSCLASPTAAPVLMRRHSHVSIVITNTCLREREQFEAYAAAASRCSSTARRTACFPLTKIRHLLRLRRISLRLL